MNNNHKSFLERGFQVYYQSIYHVKEQCFSKCEVLLRLYDKELGWVFPAEFIPIAEENGSICELGKFVLEQACSILEKREKEHLPSVQVNVNVSAIEFATEHFYEGIVDTIRQYQINPASLDFEIIHMQIVNHVVKFAKKLQFNIVAEGVEELEQYHVLERLGCDYIQGYIFLKPLPEQEFFEFLAKNEKV